MSSHLLLRERGEVSSIILILQWEGRLREIKWCAGNHTPDSSIHEDHFLPPWTFSHIYLLLYRRTYTAEVLSVVLDVLWWLKWSADCRCFLPAAARHPHAFLCSRSRRGVTAAHAYSPGWAPFASAKATGVWPPLLPNLTSSSCWLQGHMCFVF